jgi:hypothetical protein
VDDGDQDRRDPGGIGDRLRRRLDAERAAAPLRPRGHDDDGDAVRREQRRADRLQYAEGDEHRQVGRKAAERGAEHEQKEARGVEELAPDHVGQASEDRQERRHRQQVGDRDPAHGAEPRAELMLEGRQQHLRNAGIDLPHERADAHGRDDEPPIRCEPCDGRHRRRLASLQDGVAHRGDRGGAGRCFIHIEVSLVIESRYDYSGNGNSSR